MRLAFVLLGSLIADISSASSEAVERSKDPFPYELDSRTDIAIGAIGTAAAGVAIGLSFTVDDVKESEINSLDRNSINAIDRTAIGNWSEGSSTASHVTLGISTALPVGVLISQAIDRRWKNTLTLFVMYAEAMAMNIVINTIFKAALQRKRPYLYDENISLETKLAESDSNESFYSAHASMSFCAAVFAVKIFSDIHPESEWRYTVWPTALALASTTGFLRYTAGKHFPTDIVIGAAVGGLVGYVVPLLHTKHGLVISLYPIRRDYTGLGASIRF